jgi:hypothetical protein
MNTHAEYRRHSYQQLEPPAAQAEERVTSELAHHRDPSLRSSQTAPGQSSKRIAWVRPTDLAAYAGPMVGRGIDLQAELIRRARRTPVTTTRAVRRFAPPTAQPSVAPQEGLQL